MRHVPGLLSIFCLTAAAHGSPLVGTGDDACTGATTISSGVIVGRTLSSNLYSNPTHLDTDHDWYRLTLSPGETMSVEACLTAMSHGPAFGYFIDIYDGGTGACPGTLISSSHSPIITNATAAAITYYLDVYAIGIPWCTVTYDLLVHVSPLLDGVPYCASTTNSRTVPAQLTIQGTTSVVADDLRFVGVNLPLSTMALLFDGSSQVAQQPFGDGNLCTGGTMNRLRIYPGSATGLWDWPLDNSTLPAVAMLAPGTTSNFQLWYRDNGGPGGSGFNLTNGVQVTFSP